MKTRPQLKYFLYSADQAVDNKSDVWTAPIPLSRKPSDKIENISISHGNYFYAVRDFLEKDSFRLILSALSQQISFFRVTIAGITTPYKKGKWNQMITFLLLYYRYGRRPVVALCHAVYAIAGVASVFLTTNFYLFTALRMLVGSAHHTVSHLPFVMG